MDHLTALDAAFLELEDSHVALHIGSAAVFEGPPPDSAQVRERWEHFVATHERYRQVLARLPFDVRRPQWRDEVVDLDFHLRRTAVPRPGRRQQLERLVGRIMSTPLDADRPLWEAWIVEGLRGGQWALLFKVHHSVVDGVGGMQTLLDVLDPKGVGPSQEDAPGALDRRPQSVARSLGRTSRRVVGVARTAVGLPVSSLRFVAGVPAGVRALRFAPPSSLNGALGRSRTYRVLTAEQAHVTAIRERCGGTVNDVVLAMVSRGFHDLLTARDEVPTAGLVRCMVPVNVRIDAENGAGANKVSFVLVDLPVEMADTRDAHSALRRRVGNVKRSSAKSAVQTGFALADHVPAPVASAFVTALRQVPQRIVTTICTNVPGPRTVQTLFGRRLVALYPYVPIGDRVRIAVAVTSYAGRLYFGVTCDRSSVPDADVFVKGMAAGLRELVVNP